MMARLRANIWLSACVAALLAAAVAAVAGCKETQAKPPPKKPPEVFVSLPTVDTVTEGNRDYNPASAYAKTIQKDNATWGDAAAGENKLAHNDSSMTCYACHTSWVTSCFERSA